MSTSIVRTHVREPDSGPVLGQGFLRWTALAFAVGFGIHGVDHVRRGMSAATTFSLDAAMGTGIVFGFAGIMAILGRTRARA
jgi:hypothetical protein